MDGVLSHTKGRIRYRMPVVFLRNDYDIFQACSNHKRYFLHGKMKTTQTERSFRGIAGKIDRNIYLHFLVYWCRLAVESNTVDKEA